MSRYKRIIGDTLRSHTRPAQEVETRIAVNVLNPMLDPSVSIIGETGKYRNFTLRALLRIHEHEHAIFASPFTVRRSEPGSERAPCSPQLLGGREETHSR